MSRWPLAYAALLRRSVRYNLDIEAIKELEKAGTALLVGPSDIGGMGTLTKDKEAVERLYHMGYAQGPRILEFVNP